MCFSEFLCFSLCCVAAKFLSSDHRDCSSRHRRRLLFLYDVRGKNPHFFSFWCKFFLCFLIWILYEGAWGSVSKNFAWAVERFAKSFLRSSILLSSWLFAVLWLQLETDEVWHFGSNSLFSSSSATLSATIAQVRLRRRQSCCEQGMFQIFPHLSFVTPQSRHVKPSAKCDSQSLRLLTQVCKMRLCLAVYSIGVCLESSTRYL